MWDLAQLLLGDVVLISREISCSSTLTENYCGKVMFQDCQQNDDSGERNSHRYCTFHIQNKFIHDSQKNTIYHPPPPPTYPLKKIKKVKHF